MSTCPFPKARELTSGLTLDSNGTLWPVDAFVPGQPLIPVQSEEEVISFLHTEFSVDRLNDAFDLLFLVAGKGNISPLHHQMVKGRTIIVTEKPDLHLVWHGDRIFIKPIPRCVFNHAFFQKFICEKKPVLQGFSTSSSGSAMYGTVAGFLRSYAKLVTHESDFAIAQREGLIPCEAEITWENWSRFIWHFKNLNDATVDRRYIYGELRLARLNFWWRVFLRGWNYHLVYTRYEQFFSTFLVGYVFLFSAVSTILGSFQVGLAAGGVVGKKLQEVAYTFAVGTLWVVTGGLAFFPVLYAVFLLRELGYALSH